MVMPLMDRCDMELRDVVRKLVGPVKGTGEHNADQDRLENMKTLCLLINDLLSDVEAAYEDADSHQASVAAIGKQAKHFLDSLALGIMPKITRRRPDGCDFRADADRRSGGLSD